MQPAHSPLRILVIVDNSEDSILLVPEIRRAQPQVMIETVRTAEAGLLRVRKAAYDLVFCDFKLPGISGLAFRKLSLELQPKTPVIILLKQSTEELEQDTYRKNTYDFLRKPVRADILHRVIQSALTRRMRLE